MAQETAHDKEERFRAEFRKLVGIGAIAFILAVSIIHAPALEAFREDYHLAGAMSPLYWEVVGGGILLALLLAHIKTYWFRPQSKAAALKTHIAIPPTARTPEPKAAPTLKPAPALDPTPAPPAPKTPTPVAPAPKPAEPAAPVPKLSSAPVFAPPPPAPLAPAPTSVVPVPKVLPSPPPAPESGGAGSQPQAPVAPEPSPA